MAPSPGDDDDDDDDDDDEKRRNRFVKINAYSFMCLSCKKNPLDCILTTSGSATKFNNNNHI